MECEHKRKTILIDEGNLIAMCMNCDHKEPFDFNDENIDKLTKTIVESKEHIETLKRVW